MDTIAVLNAVGITDKAFRREFQGTDSFSRSIAFCRSLPETRNIVLLTDRQLPPVPDARVVRRERWDLSSLLEALEDVSAGCAHLLYAYADCPFLDAGLTRRMYGNHVKYLSNYTFADGYPYGLAPEIIDTSILPVLKKLAEGAGIEMNREAIFRVMQKDINAFDLETEIASKDYRLLRISLTCDTERNFLLSKNIYDNGGTDELSVLRTIDEQGELLRTLPAYVSIQITEGCPQTCSYCPYPQFSNGGQGRRGCMDVTDFAGIVEQISRLTPDVVIGIGLWGEPSLHDRFVEILQAALRPESNRIVIETCGIGWTQDVLDECLAVGKERIDWIVSLDTVDETLYGTLRGTGFAEACDTARYLIDTAGDHAHVQAVRMKANERDLERFFRTWKEKSDKVIIQKYDHFCGYLPDRKVTDLSPIRREPCWHVKRDICILMDGTVPRCREDLTARHALGNVFRENLSEIWEKNRDLYTRHVRGEYPDLCAKCDEYYTYNF